MSLMVLGTASHVGKSSITAAVCRCIANRNISVAPFKSQNMSLNSYVTPESDEIGIAQAMQAMAAGIEPSADMNPILLKPKGDNTSQVVLFGKPYKDVHIGEYYCETDDLLEKALDAYYRLEERYKNVVVEGAGGAAEINLYDRDIANVRLAKRLRIPVLLVADIERGGVFAQIIGTLELLPEECRQLVCGIVINKFRGDPELFSDGKRMIEELCKIPVLGVIPYSDIPLTSEDSLSIQDKKGSNSPVKIAVIRLPHISNFTDFELLEQKADLTYVNPGRSLAGFDCIIIPGTKNTIEDLEAIKEAGMDREIMRARERKIPIIGICGGFQMLGTEIADEGIESIEGLKEGLGLLKLKTRFSSYQKTTLQVRHRATAVPPILSRIKEVSGYEIHMGTTERLEEIPAFEEEGAVTSDGLVIGTYMHGLFSNPDVADALLSYLYSQKGLIYDQVSGAYESTDAAIEAFAEHFEANFDLSAILPYFRG